MECNVQFRSDNCLFGTVFETGDSFFTADFGVMTGVTPELYDGGYELWPALTDETLQTKDRLMANDVMLHAIPRYVVDNAAGGRTMTIGG